MASGDVVGAILQSLPPAATRADPGIRAGGSTPAENWPVIRFDGDSDEHWDFLCACEGLGASAGLTIELPWMSVDQITGDCVWNAAIRRLNDDAVDLDVSHSYQYNAVTDTTASAAGELSYPTITFTTGTDMDSLADGDRFMLRIRRDADNASDTMTGDAELLWPAIIIRET